MKNIPRLLTAILLISMMTLTACSDGKIQEQVTFKSIKETENPKIKLNIVETDNPDDFKQPLFAHARVGKNEVPQSKIDAFAYSTRHGLGNRADIAFFKFCYVDIKPETNVEKVLSSYKNIMASLKETYPKTTLIHVTAPLTTRQSGIKAWIKKIIGRPVRGIDDNIKRNQFNDHLRKEYTRKDPVFDLAAIECTAPDGTRASFVKNGKTYYQLVSDYTDDGGHLNKRGRKKVAEQLLILLAELSQ